MYRLRSKIERPGIPVRDDLVRQLAMLVDDEALAAKLQSAGVRDIKILALEVDERETIIRALDDPPAGLQELRGVLVREVEWRRRERL